MIKRKDSARELQLTFLLTLLVLLVGLGGTSARGSTESHVATWGNDGNDGSPTGPFRTINKALGVSQTVWVEQGTYEENVVFHNPDQRLYGGLVDVTNHNDRSGVSVIRGIDVTKPVVDLCHAQIDGFEVTGGGIGIYDGSKNFGPCDAFITNCLVTHNTDGGVTTTLDVGASPLLTAMHVANTTLTDNGNYGLGLTNMSVEVMNSNISGNHGVGVVFSSSQLRLENCTVEGNSEEGLTGLATATVFILNSTLRSNGKDGIYLDVPVGEITSNTITQNGSNGICCGAYELIISGNTISQNAANGILARDSIAPAPTPEPSETPPPQDPIILNNVIEGNLENGVKASEHSYCLIGNNIIQGNNNSGVMATDHSTAIADGNDVRKNGNYGVWTSGDSQPTVMNNNIVWNFNGGIRAEDRTAALLNDNLLCWNRGEGLIVAQNSRPLCTGNIFAGNNGVGILCKHSSAPVITDENIIWGNFRDGIEVIDYAQPVIERNIVANNLQKGVHVSDNSLARVVNNTIAENKEDGVVCEDAALPVINNNIIVASSGYGIKEASDNADPASLCSNCFYNNYLGDYLDEASAVCTGGDTINSFVTNGAGLCRNNFTTAPLFVRWGTYSRDNPLIVDSSVKSVGSRLSGTIFGTITRAVVSYSYHLAVGSDCIGRGDIGQDVGAYPYPLGYEPQGNDAVTVRVRTGSYAEGNVIVNHKVRLVGENATLSCDDEFTILYPETGTLIEDLRFVGGNMAIYCKPRQDPLIRGNTIEGSSMRGIFCLHSSPTIVCNTLRANQRYGVHLYDGSPRLQNCSIEQSGEDGIVCEAGSAPSIVGTSIINSAQSGIVCQDSCAPNVLDCQIADNQVGISCADNAAPVVAGCEISRNLDKGVFVNGASAPRIYGNVFTVNGVAAIYCQGGASPAIEANIIENNTWDGIYCFRGANPTIVNNMLLRQRNNGITLAENVAPLIVNNTIYGSYNAGVSLTNNACPILNNNIVAANQGYGVTENDPSCDPAALLANDFFSNALGDYRDEGMTGYSGASQINSLVNNGGNPISANIDGDPQFADASGNDFHITATSLCKDVGTSQQAPSVDFEGDRRPQGAGYDIGADEFGVHLSDDFSGGTDGWTFGSVPALFESPDNACDGGCLRLTARSNTNTFGFWTSAAGTLPVFGDELYRARVVASTDIAVPSQAPTVRLRIHSQNFQQTDFLKIDSSGNGDFSPTPSGRTYDLYFRPAEAKTSSSGDSDSMVGLDMMNFEPSDAANASIYFHSISIERIPEEVMAGATTIRDYTFETSLEGWNFAGAIAPFTSPKPGWVNGALQLTAINNTYTFGFWYSPAADIVLGAAAELYKVSFAVASDQCEGSCVPEMRLRLNAGDNQSCVVKDVFSNGNGANSPICSPKVYSVYYAPPSSAAGSALIISFDMLNFNPEDDAAATLALHRVVVEKSTLAGVP